MEMEKKKNKKKSPGKNGKGTLKVSFCPRDRDISPNKKFLLKFLALSFFYGRELNLVSKCRKMNNLYWEIIKITS